MFELNDLTCAEFLIMIYIVQKERFYDKARTIFSFIQKSVDKVSIAN